MEKLTTGRRVASFGEIERPGDYAGPFEQEGVEWEVCYFLLPIARDEDVDPGARSIHAVHFPPHKYRECADGSLEIRESIGAYGHRLEAGHVWHGYLDEGHIWREL